MTPDQAKARSSSSPARAILDDAQNVFRTYKRLADRALEQVDDASFVRTIDDESNSLALIVKHISGNLRSRWTDFLTSDGEKPARQRDQEFEQRDGDSRASLMKAWEDGWQRMFDSIGSLGEADILATVIIRGEPHTVVQAINRSLAHTASHVGQIIFLAKHLQSSAWQTLSIPRGKSAEYLARAAAGKPTPT